MADDEPDHKRISDILSQSFFAKAQSMLSGVYYAIAIGSTILTLVVYTIKQQAHILELDHTVAGITERLNDIDVRGSRALAERVAILNNQMNNLDSRETKGEGDLAQRLNAVTARMDSWVPDIKKIGALETRQNDIFHRLDSLERSKK